MAATVKPAICPCNKGWACEDHPDQPWEMMAAELPESFVEIHTATKMWILCLNLFATAPQRNDLAVLSHSFDRRPTALIR